VTIPNITIPDAGVPNIIINGTGIRFIRDVRTWNPGIANIQLAELRPWETTSQVVTPLDPPVVINIGQPIVDIPGCVKVHKENTGKDPSLNKNLVNDDPKGNVVACDAGMPYYEPPNYDARELTWQTVYTEQDEVDEGVDTGDIAQAEFDTPETPEIPPTGSEKVECPPPNARRIGDRNQKGDEQVKEYKLTPDGKICETIWEPVPAVEQYLPTVGTVSTTAVIATVATTSALFAKPLADLILRVVKPVIKKVMGKVNSILGRQTRRPSRSEVLADQYRLKKGLLPLKKTLKKKK
tara:strand:- start:655 stop:1539 length:885 start_codon:yes stop_codon:yes gene_type:complete